MTAVPGLCIRSPFMSPSPAAGRSPASPPPAAPCDLATVSAAPTDDDAPPPTRTWIAAGALALALAAPALAAAAPTAEDAPTPPTTSVSTTVAAAQPDPTPAVAVPTPFDNQTARQVRSQYGDLARQAARETDTFSHDASRLDRLGAELDGYARKGPGTYRLRAFTVKVEGGGAASRVVLQGGGLLRESTRQGDTRTVHARDGSGDETLVETPASRSTTEIGVTRTLYRQDGGGFLAGDFTVARQGPHGESHLLVRGGSLQLDTQENIAGFAGNITIERQENFDAPKFTPKLRPRTVLQLETVTRTQSGVTGSTTEERRTVDVRDNGSTRIQTSEQRTEAPYVEAPAAPATQPVH